MNDQREWWLGVADLLASGSGHGVEKIKRVHLAIADESFLVLDAIAVTRPWARIVKHSHDGISSLCYSAVRLGVRSVGDTIEAVACPGDQNVKRDGSER